MILLICPLLSLLTFILLNYSLLNLQTALDSESTLTTSLVAKEGIVYLSRRHCYIFDLILCPVVGFAM